MIPAQPKTCEFCGAPIIRKHRLSARQWESRRFCSWPCSHGAMLRNKPVVIVAIPARCEAHEPEPDNHDAGEDAPVTVAHVTILAGDPYWSPRMKRVEV